MNCPICNVELMASDRQGVEIDYCPQCRGIWLDRDELDKVIERTLPGGGPRGGVFGAEDRGWAGLVFSAHELAGPGRYDQVHDDD